MMREHSTAESIWFDRGAVQYYRIAGEAGQYRRLYANDAIYAAGMANYGVEGVKQLQFEAEQMIISAVLSSTHNPSCRERVSVSHESIATYGTWEVIARNMLRLRQQYDDNWLELSVQRAVTPRPRRLTTIPPESPVHHAVALELFRKGVILQQGRLFYQFLLNLSDVAYAMDIPMTQTSHLQRYKSRVRSWHQLLLVRDAILAGHTSTPAFHDAEYTHSEMIRRRASGIADSLCDMTANPGKGLIVWRTCPPPISGRDMQQETWPGASPTSIFEIPYAHVPFESYGTLRRSEYATSAELVDLIWSREDVQRELDVITRLELNFPLPPVVSQDVRRALREAQQFLQGGAEAAEFPGLEVEFSAQSLMLIRRYQFFLSVDTRADSVSTVTTPDFRGRVERMTHQLAALDKENQVGKMSPRGRGDYERGGSTVGDLLYLHPGPTDWYVFDAINRTYWFSSLIHPDGGERFDDPPDPVEGEEVDVPDEGAEEGKMDVEASANALPVETPNGPPGEVVLADGQARSARAGRRRRGAGGNPNDAVPADRTDVGVPVPRTDYDLVVTWVDPRYDTMPALTDPVTRRDLRAAPTDFQE